MNERAMKAEEALCEGLKLPYAFLRTLSKVTLGAAPQELDRAELIEARFFGNGKEIFVFKRNDALQGVLWQADENTPHFEETFEIENPRHGKTITLRHELGADEDGQASITGSHMVGWQGGAPHE